MPQFIVLQGLQASGKTTIAMELMKKDPANWVRVNNDDLRMMLWGHPHDSKNEDLITQLRNILIDQAMVLGKNIIVDNVNLNPKRLKEYRDLVANWNLAMDKKYWYDYTESLIECDIEKCIIRDAGRKYPVGERVIRSFAKSLPKKYPVKLEQDCLLEHAIICDVDGTLALFPGRNPYDRDFSKDELNKPIADILERFGGDCRILTVSGRSDKFRNETAFWLDDCGIQCDALFMRKEGDKREDSEVKREIFDNEIRGKFYIEFVMDDRNRLVKMWRDLGLTCLQVAEGDF